MPDAPAFSTSTLWDGPLRQLIDLGGPVMVVLLAIALAGLVTFVYLMLCGALYAPRLNRPLKRAIGRWQHSPDPTCVESLDQQAGRLARLNPLHQLVVGAMTAQLAQQNPQHIREAVAQEAQQSLEPFEAPLKVIEVIAALAPLLGLLGTVLGMMEAFSAMAATEGRANATQLSGGIYEALTTTAAGLVVAIPFAALAAWIEFRLRRIHRTINATLVTVLTAAAPAERATALETAETRSETSWQNPENQPAVSPTFAEHNRRFAHATG